MPVDLMKTLNRRPQQAQSSETSVESSNSGGRDLFKVLPKRQDVKKEETKAEPVDSTRAAAGRVVRDVLGPEGVVTGAIIDQGQAKKPDILSPTGVAEATLRYSPLGKALGPVVRQGLGTALTPLASLLKLGGKGAVIGGAAVPAYDYLSKKVKDDDKL